MTVDQSHWVGKDVSNGVPSHPRPDRPDPDGWSLEAIAAMERPHDISVSRDGASIAYVLDREGSSDIWLVSIDDPGRARRLTTNRHPTPYWEDEAPAWSPNGSRIAYVTEGGIWVTRSDGGVPERIADGWTVKWLSDSTLLIAVDHEGVSRLGLVEVENGWPTMLTPTGLDATAPTISADGSVVAFLSHPPDDRKRSDPHRW